MKKINFYNVRSTIKAYPESKYYMVYGERSNGKTYSSLDFALERFFHKGSQFAYIRRFGEDIKASKMQELFSSHIADGKISHYSKGAFNSVKYGTGKFYPVLFDEEANKVKEYSPEPLGYVFDLSGMEHYKSISFPKVDLIIFDEFLSRQGYLPNEFVLFMNTLSTIIRQRENVIIIMLGNPVNKYCPYFGEMGLTHVHQQKEGTVDLYNYGHSKLQVCVEYCPSLSDNGGKPSDIYFAFDNPRLRMITGGAWEIDVYPHLESRFRYKDVVCEFFIEFSKDQLRGRIIVGENDYFLFISRKTSELEYRPEDFVYGTSARREYNIRMGFQRQTDKLSKMICQLIASGRVFYSDNETGEVLRNYIKWDTKQAMERR